MPKHKTGLVIDLDLLKPQSNPEKIPLKLIRWLLSFGRYIFIFVEALVLIAFIARFKLDADLSAKKEAIDEQIPYIESLKPYEALIKNTQLKLTTIGNIKTNSLDWPLVFKKIADKTPTTTKITSINIAKNVGNTVIHIAAQTQINNDISNFVAGLKEDSTFSNISITNVGLELGVINFTIDASARAGGGGKSL